MSTSNTIPVTAACSEPTKMTGIERAFARLCNAMTGDPGTRVDYLSLLPDLLADLRTPSPGSQSVPAQRGEPPVAQGETDILLTRLRRYGGNDGVQAANEIESLRRERDEETKAKNIALQGWERDRIRLRADADALRAELSILRASKAKPAEVRVRCFRPKNIRGWWLDPTDDRLRFIDGRPEIVSTNGSARPAEATLQTAEFWVERGDWLEVPDAPLAPHKAQPTTTEAMASKIVAASDAAMKILAQPPPPEQIGDDFVPPGIMPLHEWDYGRLVNQHLESRESHIHEKWRSYLRSRLSTQPENIEVVDPTSEEARRVMGSPAFKSAVDAVVKTQPERAEGVDAPCECPGAAHAVETNTPMEHEPECSMHKPAAATPSGETILPWPDDLTTLIGKRITTRMKPGCGSEAFAPLEFVVSGVLYGTDVILADSGDEHACAQMRDLISISDPKDAGTGEAKIEDTEDYKRGASDADTDRFLGVPASYEYRIGFADHRGVPRHFIAKPEGSEAKGAGERAT